MSNLLLLILLLIIVAVLILILYFGLAKNVTPTLVPAYRNTGFDTPVVIRNCAIYHTFSLEPEIVDQLEGVEYQANDSYLCQDGSLQQLAKYTNVCQLDAGCIGLNGTIYHKGQRQYFYQTCGTELTACPTLGVWFVNGRSGQCLDIGNKSFNSCSPTTTLVYDNTLRQSGLNSCLLSSLALADCTIAPNWFYTNGYLCSGDGCLASDNSGRLILVPDYQNSNLDLLLVPAR